MAVLLIAQHIVWTPNKEDKVDAILAMEENILTTLVPIRWYASVIKMSEQLYNNAFKRRLYRFQLH